MTRAQHVELVTTTSVAEAEQLAARLRDAGIAAHANAQPVPPDPKHIGRTPPLRYHAFVLVPEADRERAWAIIYAEQVPEGPATPAEIEAELLAAAEGEDGDEEDDDEVEGEDEDGCERDEAQPGRWSDIVEQCWVWGFRIALLGWGAFIVYGLVHAMFA